jgi:hypothetical protein
MRRAILLASAMAAVVAPLAALADTLTYRNARFGTTLTFPAEIFSMQMEPPANGDGMTWLSDDGASLAVYASNNALMLSPRAFADQASQGGERFEVTYRRVADDWVVLSGYEDGQIFYYRFEFGGDDVIHSMLLKYPPTLRDRYDPLTGRIAATLDGP